MAKKITGRSDSKRQQKYAVKIGINECDISHALLANRTELKKSLKSFSVNVVDLSASDGGVDTQVQSGIWGNRCHVMKLKISLK
jgi:hypothetical protein